MSDPIERPEVINALKEAYWEFANDDTDMVDTIIDWAIRKIEELSSAQRTGRWIYNDYGNGCGNWHCSVCNKIPIVYDKNANYCQYCGVKMKGEHNG